MVVVVEMKYEHHKLSPDDFYRFVSDLDQEQANHFFLEYLVSISPVSVLDNVDNVKQIIQK